MYVHVILDEQSPSDTTEVEGNDVTIYMTVAMFVQELMSHQTCMQL